MNGIEMGFATTRNSKERERRRDQIIEIYSSIRGNAPIKLHADANALVPENAIEMTVKY
jgi:hypothetical protein